MLATKPATKLYNAWLAEVPVLAGPEPAYAEARRSSLDYLAVSSAADVIAAVDRLRSTAGLYQALVRNGRERAVEFDVGAIRARWLDLFDREILPAARSGPSRAGWSRRAWYTGAHYGQKLASRVFKARVGYERWCLFAPWGPDRIAEALQARVGALRLPMPDTSEGPSSTFR